MRHLGALLAALTLALVGCASDDGKPCTGASPAQSEGGGAALRAGTHSVGIRAVLTPDGDGEQVSFLTVAASPYSLPREEIVGAWYYAATFTGGFDQGVDLDLDHTWGQVPESLIIEYRSPAKFADGPYDLALIIYTKTAITEAIREDFIPPVPAAEELSAFSISQERVKPGDRGFSNGVIRVNVEGGDAEVTLENRLPASSDGVLGALTDTILTVP